MLFKLLNVFDHQDHQKNVKTAQGTITPDHWFVDRVGIRLLFCRRNEVESEKFPLFDKHARLNLFSDSKITTLSFAYDLIVGKKLTLVKRHVTLKSVLKNIKTLTDNQNHLTT